MIIDNYVHVLGLTDNADGNAYKSEDMLTETGYAFTTAIDMLTRCDHVLMVDDEAYNNYEHDYLSLAKYSIHISAGIYAKPTGKYENVNKL